MKKLSLLFVVFVFVFVLSGCATSVMTSEKTLLDGTMIKYKVALKSFGQDFKGSDLAASLDPEGKTTVKAGAIDNTAAQINADIAKSFVELMKIMLPYIATPAITTIP